MDEKKGIVIHVEVSPEALATVREIVATAKEVVTTVSEKAERLGPILTLLGKFGGKKEEK